jgi:catechol 2,3-dioxygenase-like lactoylglutathione lyase family enzyme
MHISHMMIYCRDQDEARDFYVDKLGFELDGDVEFGENFRWLTVRIPGQDVVVCLMPTHAGPHPPEVVERIQELLALGGMMGGILNTDDCRRDYETLRERGVEFTEEPEERFYGIDCGFRDPSGIPWRLTQPAEVVVPPAG